MLSASFKPGQRPVATTAPLLSEFGGPANICLPSIPVYAHRMLFLLVSATEANFFGTVGSGCYRELEPVKWVRIRDS